MNVSRTLVRCCLILLGALFALRASGQVFYKTYPAPLGNCLDLAQADDGGYWMVGTFAGGPLQKVNAAGVVQWSVVDAFSGGRGMAVCKGPDGACVALGENHTGAGTQKMNIVVKIDDDGVKQWELALPNGTLPNGLKDMVATNDGAFLLAGNTRDAQSKQDVWLVKVSAAGAVLWEKSFGIPELNEQVVRAIALADGSFAVTGTLLEAGNNRNLFLAKADAGGNLLWQKKYNKPGYQVAYDLLQSPDGGFVLLGDNLQSDPLKPVVLKTDADGNEAWYKLLNVSALATTDPELHVLQSFTSDLAGNLYIPLNTSIDVLVGSDLYLVKLDPFGNLLDNYHLGNHDYVHRVIRTADAHLAMAGGNETTRSFLLKTDLVGQVFPNKITGTVYDDDNDNCLPDGGEGGLENFIIKARNASGEVFYQKTAADGSYTMQVTDGDFELSALAPNGQPAFWQPCDTPVISLTGTNQIVTAPTIGVRTLIECPAMTMDIAANLLRRCMPSIYYINYCNNGSLTATDVQVQLSTDTFLIFQNSSVGQPTINGNLLSFDLPDLAPGACGDFQVQFLVSCAASLGQSLCVEAHIFPDTFCLPADPNWDGSQIEVSGKCDGEVEFTIHNSGSAHMTQPLEYVIIEDQIMYFGTFQLNAAEDTVIALANPDHHAFYLRASQSPGAPAPGNPSAVVQHCGGQSAIDLAMQLPPNELSPFTSIHCTEVIGSFDPNDKRGFPLGWKDEHFIEPGQEIEYMIRFQNTGNDTAFAVIVRDAISPLLELGSLRPGPASHPYTWEIEPGNVLTVRFPGIRLADSIVNEPASHGFVMFSLQPVKDLPLETVIENSAAIYFDFNDPVITNTYFHTLGQNLLSAVVDIQKPATLALEVFPNPFGQETRFHLPNARPGQEFRLTLYDLFGRMRRDESFSGDQYRFERQDLTAGTYFFRIQDKNGQAVAGKIVVQR